MAPTSSPRNSISAPGRPPDASCHAGLVASAGVPPKAPRRRSPSRAVWSARSSRTARRRSSGRPTDQDLHILGLAADPAQKLPAHDASCPFRQTRSPGPARGRLVEHSSNVASSVRRSRSRPTHDVGRPRTDRATSSIRARLEFGLAAVLDDVKRRSSNPAVTSSSRTRPGAWAPRGCRRPVQEARSTIEHLADRGFPRDHAASRGQHDRPAASPRATRGRTARHAPRDGGARPPRRGVATSVPSARRCTFAPKGR